MPPSGFKNNELKSLGDFTRNILTRFEAEVASGIHSNLQDGIAHELDIINKNLENASFTEKAVLSFVQNIYFAYQEAEDIDTVCNQILELEQKEYAKILS